MVPNYVIVPPIPDVEQLHTPVIPAETSRADRRRNTCCYCLLQLVFFVLIMAWYIFGKKKEKYSRFELHFRQQWIGEIGRRVGGKFKFEGEDKQKQYFAANIPARGSKERINRKNLWINGKISNKKVSKMKFCQFSSAKNQNCGSRLFKKYMYMVVQCT